MVFITEQTQLSNDFYKLLVKLFLGKAEQNIHVSQFVSMHLRYKSSSPDKVCCFSDLKDFMLS